MMPITDIVNRRPLDDKALKEEKRKNAKLKKMAEALTSQGVEFEVVKIHTIDVLELEQTLQPEKAEMQ